MAISPNLLIPRPVRDLFDAQAAHDLLERTLGSSGNNFAISLFRAVTNQAIGSLKYSAVIRTALAALTYFAVVKTGAALPIAAVLTGIVSLPTLAIGTGTVLVYHGIAAIAASLSTGSFVTLGLGLSAAAGGWLTLEYHDILPYGLGEGVIQGFANKIYTNFLAWE